MARETKQPRAPQPEAQRNAPRGLYWDPFSVLDALGYRERPTAATFDVLRSLPVRIPILGGMILNATKTLPRVAGKPPKDKGTGVGLVCRPKGWKPGDKLTKSDERFADFLVAGLMRGHMDPNGAGYVKLGKFLEQLTYASYVYDQVCYEIIDDMKGRPLTWLPAASASMRLANQPYTYPIALRDDPEVPYTTQVYQGQIVQQYGFYEMAFAVRNPRTEIDIGGYGTCEGEMTAHTLAFMLNADLYHTKMFSQGVFAKGIFNIKGNVDPEKYNEFKRDLYLQIMGVKNAGVMPVTRAPEGIDFIDLRQSSKEMEFGNLYDFSIKVVGAHMLMDPAEIHFRYGTVGQKQSLASESNRERVTDSRARWLPPLADFHTDHLTTYIVERWDSDWEARVIGLDALTPKEQHELMEIKLRTTHTVDEARAELGMDPYEISEDEDEPGNIIPNPTLVQWLGQQQAAAQADEQQAAGGGMPGEPGAGPPGAEGEAGGEEGGDQFQDLLSQLDQGGGEGEEAGGGAAPAQQQQPGGRGNLKKSRRYDVEV